MLWRGGKGGGSGGKNLLERRIGSMGSNEKEQENILHAWQTNNDLREGVEGLAE